MSKDKIMELVEEVVKEAQNEGRCGALYDHTDFGHTVQYRAKMLNHGLIKDKILKEIKYALETKAES